MLSSGRVMDAQYMWYSEADFLMAFVKHFMWTLRQGSCVRVSWYIWDSSTSANEWKCCLSYVHIVYFYAVQSVSSVTLMLTWYCNCWTSEAYLSVRLMAQDFYCLLCTSNAACVHGFISSGILCFHCFEISVLIYCFISCWGKGESS